MVRLLRMVRTKNYALQKMRLTREVVMINRATMKKIIGCALSMLCILSVCAAGDGDLQRQDSLTNFVISMLAKETRQMLALRKSPSRSAAAEVTQEEVYKYWERACLPIVTVLNEESYECVVDSPLHIKITSNDEVVNESSTDALSAYGENLTDMYTKCRRNYFHVGGKRTVSHICETTIPAALFLQKMRFKG